MLACFLPGAIHPLEFMQSLTVTFACVLDRLFHARNLRADRIKLTLHGVTVIGCLGLLAADTLDLRLNGALIGNGAFKLYLLCSDGAIGTLHLGVERPPTQR